ncbi:MAG: SagB/ThcOx family dehydrogenase [Thermoplasmata archaeon]
MLITKKQQISLLNFNDLNPISLDRDTRINEGLLPININEYHNRFFNKYDIAELYHENSKLYRSTDSNIALSIAQLKTDPALLSQYLITPTYDTIYSIDTHGIVLDGKDKSLRDCIFGRKSIRNYTAKEIEDKILFSILNLSAGKTREESIKFHDQIQKIRFRAIPSGGALYPVDIFILLKNVRNIENGIYWYNPNNYILNLLTKDQDRMDMLDKAMIDQNISRDYFALFVLVGNFWRSRVKYGPRAYRFVLLEAGHLAQNILLSHVYYDLGSVPLQAFIDDEVSRALLIDGVDIAPLYVIAGGTY